MDTLKPPKPPKIGRKDGLAPNLTNAPENVQLGVKAWWAVAAMQALIAVTQFLGNLIDPGQLRQSLNQTLDQQPELRRQMDAVGVSLDTLGVLYSFAVLGIMLFVSALFTWLAWRAGRGASNARMLLNVGSLYLAITALLMVFSSAPSSLPVALVLVIGILTILSGVVAVVGIYFMSRPTNAEWFGIPSIPEMEKYLSEREKWDKERKAKRKAERKAKRDEKNNGTNQNHKPD